MSSMINSTLPIQMKVLDSSYKGHYTLLLNHKKISTKSLIELEVGAEYLAELYTDKGGILQFKNLSKRPNLLPFEEGLSVIVALLETKINFKDFVINSICECKNRQKYQILKEMLFASYENIYHIPFIFENKACLFQMRKNENFIELYLYFSVFGALKIIIDKKGVSIFTPFLKVQKFLNKHLEYNVLHDNKLKPLYTFKKLFDFKG
ncbi:MULTISPECIES: hypothetical protein [unclassified Campylobacter]|uniref:hypothetical protein n=1 Tax=unclassified Campylobacter TaxID=2593542 RepID=UPI001CC2090A|nr:MULTISPECIES: hypothetical protein [unclassified Campylobacter]